MPKAENPITADSAVLAAPILSPRPQTVEINVNVTGKIPRRLFENFSPYFSIKEVYRDEISDSFRLSRQKLLYEQVERLFSEVRDGIKVEELQEQYKNLRFTAHPKTGKKYPHVTDILYWDAEFYVSPEELSQYGARGSAVHSMIENWVKTKEWTHKAINKRDLILLKTGSLRLYESLDKINFLGFMEKYGKKIEYGDGEFRGFNVEHFYCGQPDRIGTYEKIPAIFDYKSREAKDDDFKQMAAYLKLDSPGLSSIKRMVIIPLNPDNKSGFGRPVVSDEPDKYFNLFLRERADFKDKFGI